MSRPRWCDCPPGEACDCYASIAKADQILAEDFLGSLPELPPLTLLQIQRQVSELRESLEILRNQ